jgi:kumamolisin
MLRTAALALALGVLCLVAGAPATASTAPPVPAGDAGFAAALPPSLSGATATTIEIAPAYVPAVGVVDLGPVRNSTPLEVVVGLGVRDAAGLAAEIDALYAPGSLSYHRFPTVAQLADDYGASASGAAAAVGYFRSFGLNATASPDRLLVSIEGPAGSVASAFRTTFDAYSRPGGGEFVSHPTPASLPPVAPWSGALGLGNVTLLEPAVTGDAPGPSAAPDASCSGSAPYIPCQIHNGYDYPAGENGTGFTIGIVDAYDDGETQTQLAQDLVSFDARYALPSPTLRFLYPVPTTEDLNATSTGWGLEEALDLEWAHASATGAAIDMTFAPNSGAGLYYAVDDLVANDLVNVVSLSWGEPDVGVYNAYSGPCASACNATSDGSYALLGPVLEFAAAEGISVFAASGDCGSADGTSGISTNFPASDPFVTGVGGTDLSLSSTGAWEGETAWSGNVTGAISPGCENQGGSGGGFSPFPRPYWQVGEGVPSAPADRGVPDVSAVATPGVEIVKGGTTEGVGGTSLATPIWAGIAAIADQSAGAPLGFLNPELYALLRGSSYSTDFEDIRSGSNGAYTAGAGWDPVTGVGAPIVAPLVADLAARPAPSPGVAVTLTASSETGPAPLVVTFSVGVSGGSGSYPWEGVSFGDGNASFVDDGSSTYEYSTPGVYAAQAYAVDSSGNFSVSVPVTIVVGGGSVLTVRLTASDPTPGTGAPVRFEANVSGGVAPLEYSYWFGDGTYLVGSAAPIVDHAYTVVGSFCAVVVVEDSADPPDGAQSPAAAIAVGGASAATCPNGTGPLAVSASPPGGVRDAPADLDPLFAVTGGSGTLAEQIVSSDPYVAACGCAIFRAPGTYPVAMYANDSAGAHVVDEVNVTIGPPLRATYTASPASGPAPLTVDFAATVSGGSGANATRWTFGNGATASGDTASATYTVPGLYWAVAQSSDGGGGNASEAILVDVLPAGAPGGSLAATIAPVTDVLSGSTVDFNASWTLPGDAPATVFWDLGDGGSAAAARAARTVYAPAQDPAAATLDGNLSLVAPSLDQNDSVPFDLGPLFAVGAGGTALRADALTLRDIGGPAGGTAPLAWTGTASADGVGPTGLAWSFGDGGTATGTAASHTYVAGGNYTVVLDARDAFGDLAVDAHAVRVTNATAAPLALTASASALLGPAPLVDRFSAVASGGSPPYRYAWTFGDGGSAATGNATHEYRSTGTFDANVTVTDADGRSTGRALTIEVVPVVGGPRSPPFGPPYLVLVLATATGIVSGLAAGFATRRRRGPPTP